MLWKIKSIFLKGKRKSQELNLSLTEGNLFYLHKFKTGKLAMNHDLSVSLSQASPALKKRSYGMLQTIQSGRQFTLFTEI